MPLPSPWNWMLVPVIYLLLLAAGRWLKQRGGVPFGATYHIFSGSVALLSALSTPEVPLDFFRLVAGVAAFFSAFVLMAVLRRILWDYYFAQKRGAVIPKFVREITSLAVFVLAVTFVAGVIYEVRIPGLLAGSGILAVILGLAMQETLGNIIAGLSLQFEKPFQTGDWLVLEGRHAEVMEVNWRSTRLRASDNIYFDIPNSQLTRQTVVNLSYPKRVHAMRIALHVDHLVPPNEVKAVLSHATAQAEGVLPDPAPRAYLTGFGEASLTYEVKFWLEDQSRFHSIQDGICTNIWYELQRHGIKLAFPVRTVQLDRRAATSLTSVSPTTGLMLRQHPVFRCLDEAQSQALLSSARQLRYGQGERIIEQGADGDSMFVVVNGDAAVQVAANGHPTTVATLRPGDCCGEMSLLTGEKRSATVVARTDCNVLEIGKAGLAALFQERPGLLKHFSDLLAQRRLENEGLLNSTGAADMLQEKHQEYSSGFLNRLKSFFKL